MDGFIIINKEKGLTSFDVIRNLRKLLKIKRIGHAGTLDPMATGVLIIAVSHATKLLQYIEAKEKSYDATMELGYETDTLDLEGVVVKNAEIPILTECEVKQALSEFSGESTQIPPMYSAIKINGQKLYELARQNIEVERKARPVTISSIKLTELETPKIQFSAVVSKGTYIRTLVSDVAKRLNSVGTMTALVRTAIGTSCLEKAYTLKEIETMILDKNYSFLHSVESVFKESVAVSLDDLQYSWFLHGRILSLSALNGFEKVQDGVVRVYHEENFIGLGTVEKGSLKRKYIKEL